MIWKVKKMLWLTNVKDNSVKNVKQITQDVLSLFQVPQIAPVSTSKGPVTKGATAPVKEPRKSSR